ncbi:MAG: c-type cytochrome [Novosphingobium sp.]
MVRKGAFAAGLMALALAGCGGPKDQAAPDAATPSSASSTTTAAADEGPKMPPVFAQCMSCHSVKPGQNGLGPSLAGVFGRKAGTGAGYDYSPALKGSGLTWDEASLDKWLTNPMGMVPGTRMTYAGQGDATKRAELIAYLKTLK